MTGRKTMGSALAIRDDVAATELRRLARIEDDGGPFPTVTLVAKSAPG
jgi:hypothetical protein